jgi:hypothetical protein
MLEKDACLLIGNRLSVEIRRMLLWRETTILDLTKSFVIQLTSLGISNEGI